MTPNAFRIHAFNEMQKVQCCAVIAFWFPLLPQLNIGTSLHPSSCHWFYTGLDQFLWCGSTFSWGQLCLLHRKALPRTHLGILPHSRPSPEKLNLQVSGAGSGPSYLFTPIVGLFSLLSWTRWHFQRFEKASLYRFTCSVRWGFWNQDKVSLLRIQDPCTGSPLLAEGLCYFYFALCLEKQPLHFIGVPVDSISGFLFRLPSAEKKRLAQGNPAAFVPKVGLKHMVFPLSPNL